VQEGGVDELEVRGGSLGVGEDVGLFLGRLKDRYEL
jgi:hypothetical protein